MMCSLGSTTGFRPKKKPTHAVSLTGCLYLWIEKHTILECGVLATSDDVDAHYSLLNIPCFTFWPPIGPQNGHCSFTLRAFQL